MPLTDLEARQAKPSEKDYKLSDAKGLHLFVKTSGVTLWRFKYRFQGKEKLLSIGRYPEIKLSQAKRHRRGANLTTANIGSDTGNRRRGRGMG
jgi:hypothetical protein